MLKPCLASNVFLGEKRLENEWNIKSMVLRWEHELMLPSVVITYSEMLTENSSAAIFQLRTVNGLVMLAICIAAHRKYYWAGFDPTRLNSAPALLDSSERSVLFPLPKPSNLFCFSGSKCALCPHHIKAWQCCNGHCTPLTRKAVLENQFWSLCFLIRVSVKYLCFVR